MAPTTAPPRRHPTSWLAALLSAALVVGCASADEGTATTSTTRPTSSSTTAPAAATAPSTTADPEPSTTTIPEEPIGSADRCLDPGSPRALAAIAALPGTEGWVPDGASDAEPSAGCPELLWMAATVSGATGSSPSHVLLFHDGAYVGTATPQPLAFTEVVGSDGATVTVRYRWLDGDEPSCCPAGGPADITFGWNGSAVTTDPPLPAALLGSAG